jgi:hypothetical protein
MDTWEPNRSFRSLTLIRFFRSRPFPAQAAPIPIRWNPVLTCSIPSLAWIHYLPDPMAFARHLGI